jgi:thiamine-monophosphate kinase
MNQSSDEFSLIHTIAMTVGTPGHRVELGIGDDAAVLKVPNGKMLFCSDAMVEDIHFDLKFTSPGDLGHKALASCLSDIAAMNGTPLYAVISVALSPSHGKEFLREFYQGAMQLAHACQIDIVGGDLSSSLKGIFIDVACVGETSQPLTRKGARPGDLLAVSGFPGSSAAGLYALQYLRDHERPEELCRRHLRPMPRFDLLPGLSTRNCTSLIDVSDGLSSEIHHLAKESNVGFAIEREKIPLAKHSIDLAAKVKMDPLTWAMNGGEDYELLATFAPTKGIPASGWTVIGAAVPLDQLDQLDQRVTLRNPDGSGTVLEARGYRHFINQVTN